MISLKKVLNLFIITIVASSLATNTRAEEIKNPEQELLIWRVDPKPGSIYSVYILSSYHVGKNCQINSPAFEHAFKDAETVVFEVDSIHTPAVVTRSQEYTLKLIRQQGIPSNSNDSLKEILDPKTYELLKEQTDTVDFPLDNFTHLKPWVFMFAYSSFQMAQSEFKSECGLDLMIAEKSQNQKDIEGLESSEYQIDKYIDLFISMDRDDIVDSIEAIAKLDSAEELSDYFDTEVSSLISYIDSGNLDSLESSINSWCEVDREQCESLLYERNRNWIPQIEQFLNQKQDSLVVVGAGHLVGEQNVIRLLKGKGYTVRRFYNSFRLTKE